MKTLGRIAVMIVCLMTVCLTSSIGYADHERFTVGEMRNVDPSEPMITSISGACVPSHDRETLHCYFTSFGVWRATSDDKLKKQFAEQRQELEKDTAKQIRELKQGLCADKKIMNPDPVRLKYNTVTRAFFDSLKTFCGNPTRETALSFLRTMSEGEAKKCRCVVSDWRSTLVRQGERWIENAGPNGLCGIITVTTLVPSEPAKMKEKVGPVLWSLTQKTVTTHKSDDPLCANTMKNPLIPTLKDESTTFSWDAPSRTLDCSDFDFTSALDGMSDPTGKWSGR